MGKRHLVHSSNSEILFYHLASHTQPVNTGDQMRLWNPGYQMLEFYAETNRNHAIIFFKCRYSQEVWTQLVKGLLRRRFVSDWGSILSLIADPPTQPIEVFLVRYVFQASISHIWKEMNDRRHGEPQTSSVHLTKIIE